MIPFLTHWIKSVDGGWGGVEVAVVVVWRGVGWCGGGGVYLAGACVIRILIRTAHRHLSTGDAPLSAVNNSPRGKLTRQNKYF